MNQTLITNILLPLLFLLIGIYFTKAYGSNFLPRKIGKAKEKYMVTDIYDFRMKSETFHLAQLQLIKSSIKNACGFADIILDNKKIIFKHYAFANNCFHSIVAPGFVLFDEDQKQMKASSNMFKSIELSNNISSFPNEMIPKRFRKQSINCAFVKISYDFPKTYTGPLYSTKDLVFAKGVGLISAVTTYKNGQKDIFILSDYKVKQASDAWWPIESIGNYWVYNIEYSVGPNKCNINH